MAQIINDPYARGGGLGAAFGGGLGAGLNQALQHKLNDILDTQKQSKLSKALQQTGNFSPQQAEVISMFHANPVAAQRMMALFGQPAEEQQQQIPQQMPIQQIDQTGIDNLQKLMAPPQQQQFQNPMIENAMQSMGMAHGQPGQPGYMPNFTQDQLSKILGQPTPEEANQPLLPERMPIPQVGGEVPAQAGFGTQRPRKTFGAFGETPQMQLAREKLAQQKETVAQKKIDSSNKKFKESLSKSYMDAFNMRQSAEEALGLIETGQTRSGLTGYAPLWGAGAETRELAKIYEDLALSLSASQRGPLSKAKIVAARATKPSLDMPIEAQKYMLNRIIDKANREGIALDDISEKIIADNDGKEPADLEQKVLQEWKKIYMPGGKVAAPINPSGGSTPPMNQPENAVEYATRLAGGVGSRIGAGAVTGLGNIASAGLGVANYLSGGKTPTYSEIQAKLPISAPTSEDASKKLSEWSKGYTDPRSSFENTLYDVAETFGSIFMPGAALGKVSNVLQKVGVSAANALKTGKILMPFSGINVPWKRALGMAAAGETGKKTAEAFGAGPIGQTATSLAFTVAAGYPGPRKAFAQEAAKSYETAKTAFADDTVNIKDLESGVAKLKSKFVRENIPHKAELDEIISGVENSLAQSPNGEMSVNELINMKQGLNARYGWSESPKITGDRSYLPKELRKPLGELIDEVKQPIAKAGLKNPQGGIPFALADDITKGLSKSSATTQWLREHSKLYRHGHTLPAILMRMTTGAGLLVPKEISQMRDFFKAYPAARKYYWNVLKAAKEENKAALVKNMANLDKIARSQKKE